MTTLDRLNGHADALDAMVRAYAAQIESGQYGDTYTVYDDDGNEISDDVPASKFSGGVPDSAELNAADEPTVDETPIGEVPHAVTDERGRPFAILLAGGGPNPRHRAPLGTFEIVAEGDDNAYLKGVWGGDHVTRYGDHYDVFLDWFIER